MHASIVGDALMGIGCVTVFVMVTGAATFALALRLGLLPEVSAVLKRLAKGGPDGG